MSNAPPNSFDDRRDRVLSYAEEERLLAALAPHLRDIFSFGLATLLRKSNTFDMRWSWVDLEHRICTIPSSNMKGKREHSFPLNDDAVEILRRNLGKNDEFVFTYQNGRIRDLDHKGWVNACKRARVDGFRWHDLRATGATRLANAGVPVHVLAKLGAWADVDILQRRYYRAKPQDLSDYANMAKRPKPKTVLKVVS